MGFFDALNPGGGLTYHFRALRHRQRLWQPFRSAIGAWLAEWQPNERHLVVVGPSAGYTLPLEWLLSFERLTLMDPDPLACWMLRRRLTHAAALQPHLRRRAPEWTFVEEDHLLSEPDRLLRYLESNGPAAILFSNVLGQLGHLRTPRAASTLGIKGAIRETLFSRSWASYHDRVSGALAPTLPAGGLCLRRRLDDAELRDLYRHTSHPLTLLDHDTDELFPENARHTYFSWQLIPGYYHLIEAVCDPLTSE